MKKTIQITGVIASAIILTMSSCTQEDSILSNNGSNTTADKNYIAEGGSNPDEAVFAESATVRRGNNGGYVYTQSNDAGQNAIYIYSQNNDGTLAPMGMTASGGAGTGSGLGSQGAVVIDKNNNWLFAVNAGSNSISSFEIHADGSLSLAHTMSSGGMSPVSICVYHKYLYVVNAGSDNIAGFNIGNNGTMTPIAGSMQSLSTNGAGAAQIAFSPNGNYLFVTEKATNKISAFRVTAGVASPGTSIASVGQTPFGFEFARNNYMVVSNAAGGAPGMSSATSYAGINNGHINAVNGAVANNQAAACWIAVTQYGRFAFATNTATDNISAYYVAPTGGLHLVHADIPSGDGPIDMVFSSENMYAYTLCAADHTIREYVRTPLGGLAPIGSMTNVPVHAVGLATF